VLDASNSGRGEKMDVEGHGHQQNRRDVGRKGCERARLGGQGTLGRCASRSLNGASG